MKTPTRLVAAIPSKLADQGSMPLRNSAPATTIARHMVAPTERSMPPTMISSVMPTTTIPSVEKDSSQARILAQVKKCSDAKLMAINNAAIIKNNTLSRILSMRFAISTTGAAELSVFTNGLDSICCMQLLL